MTTKLENIVAIAAAESGCHPHPCTVVGHKWKSIGGCNAGCSDTCSCSVPVYECEVCGDCDYGDTQEAKDIRAECVAVGPGRTGRRAGVGRTLVIG